MFFLVVLCLQFDLENFEEAMKLKLEPNDSIKTIIKVDKNYKE